MLLIPSSTAACFVSPVYTGILPSPLLRISITVHRIIHTRPTSTPLAKTVMSTPSDFKLTPEQIASFMRHGWVRVPRCFSREKAAEWTADVWTRLGYSPTDKSTWKTEITWMPEHKSEPVKTFAPRAWAAICELLGGESRVAEHSATWNDAFIVNLGTEETVGKCLKPTDLDGWHVDGDFFTHFLDSPEQGLLVIPLFTDIQERAGGTMVCSDAIKVIAQYLVSILRFPSQVQLTVIKLT